VRVQGRKLAVLALRNIANNAAVMDVMVNVGVVPPLIKLIEMAGTNQGLQVGGALHPPPSTLLSLRTLLKHLLDLKVN
jgi:hypothetical protein